MDGVASDMRPFPAYNEGAGVNSYVEDTPRQFQQSEQAIRQQPQASPQPAVQQKSVANAPMQQQQQPVYQQPPASHPPPSTYQPTTGQAQPQAPPQPQQQQQSFLAAEPANPSGPLARHSSQYGDWMTPAAAGVAGAGAGAFGAEAYRHRWQDEDAAVPEPKPEPMQAETRQMGQPSEPEPASNAAAFLGNRDTSLSQPSDSTGSVISSSTAATDVSTSSGELGGLEGKGAHETGSIFPAVVRHNTNMSVSALHVPGEYPKRG